MGSITHNGEVLQSLPANASQINFDKTGTDLNATQAEAAIKEVNGKVNTNAEDITQLKSGLTRLNGSLSPDGELLRFAHAEQSADYVSELRGGTTATLIIDKVQSGSISSSIRLLLNVEQKKVEVGYYDGTNWQYQTVVQFT